MTCCSIELKTRNYIKGYGFLSFGRNLANKCGRKLFDKNCDQKSSS